MQRMNKNMKKCKNMQKKKVKIKNNEKKKQQHRFWKISKTKKSIKTHPDPFWEKNHRHEKMQKNQEEKSNIPSSSTQKGKK